MFTVKCLSLPHKMTHPSNTYTEMYHSKSDGGPENKFYVWSNCSCTMHYEVGTQKTRGLLFCVNLKKRKRKKKKKMNSLGDVWDSGVSWEPLQFLKTVQSVRTLFSPATTLFQFRGIQQLCSTMCSTTLKSVCKIQASHSQRSTAESFNNNVTDYSSINCF